MAFISTLTASTGTFMASTTLTRPLQTLSRLCNSLKASSGTLTGYTSTPTASTALVVLDSLFFGVKYHIISPPPVSCSRTPDPDPLVRGMNPDPLVRGMDPDPNPSMRLLQKSEYTTLSRPQQLSHSREKVLVNSLLQAN